MSIAPRLDGRALVVLTGAGLSTDSGIPDYRGPDAPARMPMTFGEFLSGPSARQRYWARSHVGWGRMKQAEPNAGHRALAALEARGRVRLLITQNVDGLHEAAGSNALALHGRISEVICLSCRTVSSRRSLQERLEELNPGYAEAHRAVLTRPDGDVDLDDTAGFVVPGCTECAGLLKPHVVFFGENVPTDRVQRSYDAVESCVDDGVEGRGRGDRGGVLLVVGSSLTVMSGLRFVKRAARLGVPVVIVNRGATRGDALATYKLEAGASEFLSELAAGLSPTLEPPVRGA
ncbi:NAD-dependent deacetylase [Nocardioides sp. JQ2195]|uniref:Sir2 family NAD-dependent protein deacetylase n=1 Tax=Nocardioides sp. JQ2195 TaxID=2592334 RepID=UPI00143E2984|nr:Sir2 family NAD-dependent protein deacetylase [Nocardioides sp. JQ2195]QIX28025.1 NAD-dependent deacetylase [Nocardioides sp. JQ2195]